ncbi:NTP/NDP exchange transporter [Pontibacter toksunensis]|uniref:NTP/NDP exchange transporter n=1 Tax=Pontibacter toksunensis TaxID=1332631 RepID=A0ABW6C3X3_9BACT
MYKRINLLLNIKPSEARLVGHLFLVQYFIGMATAFLFTSSLTLILSSYPVVIFPKIYILAAVLLFFANLMYSRLEARMSPDKLLQVITVFSAVSVWLYWLCLTFFSFEWLPPLLGAWNMVVYMLVGYAFWGMTAIMFNVRESKRLFSIVGAGDIPAKMLGYFSVTALVPLIGVVNLLWVSVVAFGIAYVLLQRFNYEDKLETGHSAGHHTVLHHKQTGTSFISRFFHNRLIFTIALWSLLAYTIYSIIDFTFLEEIKLKYSVSDHELATFIAIFFALGRLLAIGIKLLFSSRVIAKLGVSNSLLIAPLLLLAINGFIILSGEGLTTHLYVFGVMVLLSEILRSTLQEPVFFVLFQPLNPHSRLKGHLIAKGYTLPFALMGVGIFLTIYLEYHSGLPITLVSRLLFILLLVWAASVFLIRKAYRSTLINVIRKGYFTGSELFLNDQSVMEVLIKKATTNKPQKAIHALHLLERSGFAEINTLLFRQLHSTSCEIKEYVITRIIEKKLAEALPLLKERLRVETDPAIKPYLIKAIYYLDRQNLSYQAATIEDLDKDCKKAAMIGLLHRNQPEADAVVAEELLKMVNSQSEDDKLIAIAIIIETRRSDFKQVLGTFLQDEAPAVYKKAIEAVGEVHDFALFDTMIQVALERKAFLPLQKALLHFGDRAFATAYVQQKLYPESLNVLFIKVAGKTRGDYSEAFLERVLEEDKVFIPEAVDALWLQKANLSEESQLLLKDWVQVRLEQSMLKASYYLHLVSVDAVRPLQDAVCSEIRQDIQVLFKSLSLLYDQQQIERVMELYNLGDPTRVYNAIEMLELIIPQKYFTGLNSLVELEQDIRKDQVVVHHTKEISASAIVEDILTENKAGFNSWTKAVACYMIPRLQEETCPLYILDKKPGQEDKLFEETRTYVLSMLN